MSLSTLSDLEARLQSADAPDPEQVLFDLERYLDAHPDAQARLADSGARFAFRTAVELFTNGLKEEALQFYELALRCRPDAVLTRLNYAIALHALAYRAAALEQYTRLMTLTSPRDHLRVWVLAAQIHSYDRDYAAVVSLLEPLAEKYFPQDPEFWELLGDAKRVAPPARFCRHCGQPRRVGAKFCGSCGKL